MVWEYLHECGHRHKVRIILKPIHELAKKSIDVRDLYVCIEEYKVSTVRSCRASVPAYRNVLL